MFRKTPSVVRNGRWVLKKNMQEAMRAVDLANSDSCYQTKIPKYIAIGDDVILLPIMSFDLYPLPRKSRK